MGRFVSSGRRNGSLWWRLGLVGALEAVAEGYQEVGAADVFVNLHEIGAERQAEVKLLILEVDGWAINNMPDIMRDRALNASSVSASER